MQKNLSLFQTLYHEASPSGSLGKGTHYSVLRALVWHNPLGTPLKKAKYHDFVVIWDEDHDERIVKVIEKIYLKGILPNFLIFGERKGIFSAVVNNISIVITDATHQDTLEKKLLPITNDVGGDVWNLEIINNTKSHNITSLISDDVHRVSAYLDNIDILWGLGLKDTE